jgi:hypothetical protein
MFKENLDRILFCSPQGSAGLYASTSLRGPHSISILLQTSRLVSAQSLTGEKCGLKTIKMKGEKNEKENVV